MPQTNFFLFFVLARSIPHHHHPYSTVVVVVVYSKLIIYSSSSSPFCSIEKKAGFVASSLLYLSLRFQYTVVYCYSTTTTMLLICFIIFIIIDNNQKFEMNLFSITHANCVCVCFRRNSSIFSKL